MLMCSKIKTKELSKTLQQAAQKAFADYPIISAYLYGSQVRGRNLSPSDIDVAVYIDPEVFPLSLDVELGLCVRLEEASGLSNIDLRILNEAPLSFQGEVLRQGIEIYSADEGKRILFETHTLDAFLDYLPHLEKLRRAFLHSVAEKGIL
ncbi:type VII toxin-antitoxin system MntA family adenylyltransferase antitoxin [Candidatus Hakubella thermalkaliphila]|uniref:Polymerase beta nucleotidyltransferase domain-containing protein n=2 Tax=Candidatus Hakubella thermalkaliphila TaxID=2754717 RepID=A0A6V8PCI1_9ACTN|nr:nucleotidyltransferase domain-containing protein [Candidatus Hakubella thermalkaliphila]MBT9169292.1 hypothetical protein [Bacillota bacterium]GFP29780.1 uncharacterized protein HKBW3S34_00701 [Candidatus Hakubella thermalkaliphila]